MTADEIRRKAESAESILNNDVFNSVWDEMRLAYIQRWETSVDGDKENRELFYNRLKALQEVKREFVRLVNAQRFLDRG